MLEGMLCAINASVYVEILIRARDSEAVVVCQFLRPLNGCPGHSKRHTQ